MCVCVLSRLPAGAADDVRREQKQVGAKHQHDKGQSAAGSPLDSLLSNVFKEPQRANRSLLINSERRYHDNWTSFFLRV